MRYLCYCVFCIPVSLHLVSLHSPFSSPHLVIDHVLIGLVLRVATLRPLYHHPSPLALIGIWLVFWYQAPFLSVTSAHLRHFSYRSRIPLRWSEGDRRIGLGLGFLAPRVCFLALTTRTTSGISPPLAQTGGVPWYACLKCLGFAASMFVNRTLRCVLNSLGAFLGSEYLACAWCHCPIGEWSLLHVVWMTPGVVLSLRGNTIEWTRHKWFPEHAEHFDQAVQMSDGVVVRDRHCCRCWNELHQTILSLAMCQ